MFGTRLKQLIVDEHDIEFERIFFLDGFDNCFAMVAWSWQETTGIRGKQS